MVKSLNKICVFIISTLLVVPFPLLQAQADDDIPVVENTSYCADGSTMTFAEFMEAKEDGLIGFNINKDEANHTAQLVIINKTDCKAPISFSAYRLVDDWSLAKQEFFDGTDLVEISTGTTTLQIDLPFKQPVQIDAWYGLYPQTLLNTNPYSFPNVPGVFIWDFAYLCDAEGIVLVSDTSTLLSSGEPAVATYADNPRWTAQIDGATWIWNSYLVNDPKSDEEEIFEKKFDLFFTPLDAVLTIAADNSYEIFINDQKIGADETELNYFDENKDSYNITQYLRHGAGESGENIITFKVKNWELASSTPQTNPAGLLYKLVIGVADRNFCPVVPPPPPPPSHNNPPTIILNGDNPIEIWVGSNFIDPGATATDTEDGDLTDSILVTGSVSTSTAGTYTLTYSVSDSKGASASVMRQVIVKECEGANICRPNRCGGIKGTPISAPSSFLDVPESHIYWSNIQQVAAKCLMVGYVGGNFGPDDDLTKGQVGIVLSRIFYKEFATTSTESVTKSELVSMMADAFEVTDELIKIFVMQGTCLDPACLANNVTRGEAAGYFVKAFDYLLDKNNCGGNTPPTISLNGDNPLNLFVGDIFTDPGAAAFDIQDGDLTEDIIIAGSVNTSTTSTSTLIYSVTDSGGLSASTTRLVIVNATTTATTTPPSQNHAPTITLLGANPLYIFVGDTFTDPGATATDTEDGNLTGSIVTTGSVSTSTISTSTLTYSVTDSGGLSAFTTRLVVVSATTTPPINNSPTVTLTANPSSITAGATSTLAWTSQNVTYCSASWTSATSTTGSQIVLPTSTTEYGMACGGQYGTTTATTTITVTANNGGDNGDDDDDNGGDSGNGGGGGSGGIGGRRRIPPLALSVASAPAIGTCSYLNDYLKIDWPNDSLEVIKLQSFLNVFEKENLDVNGTFDGSTFEAVERFQNKYFNDILAPWGHDTPTGFVYILTKKKINEIYCNTLYSLTLGQQAEIETFRNYLESLRGYNYEDYDIDVSGSVGLENEDFDFITIEDTSPIGNIATSGKATTTSSVLLSTLSRIKEKLGDTLSFMNGGAAISLFSVPENVSDILKYVLEIILILTFTYSISAFAFNRQFKDEADKIKIKRRKLWFSSAILVLAIAGAFLFSKPRLILPLGIILIVVALILLFGRRNPKEELDGEVNEGGAIAMPAPRMDKHAVITTINPILKPNEKLDSQIEEIEKPIEEPTEAEIVDEAEESEIPEESVEEYVKQTPSEETSPKEVS